MEGDQQCKVVLIRHAESMMNRSTEDFVTKNNLIYDWEHLSQNHDYLHTVKYGYHLLDAEITQTGYQQCKEAKGELNQCVFDLILVSPLNRALQTCYSLFGQAACPVIVQPILAEGLRSSCDFSSLIGPKKVQYPTYNFSKVQLQGQFWMINNDSEANQVQYNRIIKANEGKSYQDIIKQIFEQMKKTFIYQTPTNLRKRANDVKLLLKEYSKSYRSICVVSHYNIIRFALAKEFNEKDEPFHCHIGNCEIKKVNLEEL